MSKKEHKRAIALGDTALGTVGQILPVPLTERFAISVNGLVVTGRPKFEEWEYLAQTLRVAEKGIQFAIGDLVLQAEDQLGEEASQLMDSTEWEQKTVEVYRWMAKQIAPERRRMDRLTVRHHLAVAALAPRLQTKWLTKAANDEGDEPWTVKRLVDAMKAGEDLPPDTWWLQVLCKSEDDQAQMQKALQAQGRTVKLLTSRKKKES